MATKNLVLLRFFGDTNTSFNTLNTNASYYLMDENLPNSLTSLELSDGSAFTEYTPIVLLGILALPGTKFSLNANLESIIVGASGIYELDLTNSSAILTSLKFDLASLDAISVNPDGYLIIDIVYLEG